MIFGSHVRLNQNQVNNIMTDGRDSTCTRLPFFVPLNNFVSAMHNKSQSITLPFVNMPSCAVATNKANGFDGRVIAYGINCGYCSMDDVQHARRKAL